MMGRQERPLFSQLLCSCSHPTQQQAKKAVSGQSKCWVNRKRNMGHGLLGSGAGCYSRKFRKDLYKDDIQARRSRPQPRSLGKSCPEGGSESSDPRHGIFKERDRGQGGWSGVSGGERSGCDPERRGGHQATWWTSWVG